MMPEHVRYAPTKRGQRFELIEAHVCESRRAAELTIAGYAGKRGYQTRVQGRCIRSNNAVLSVWVATVYRKVEGTIDAPQG